MRIVNGRQLVVVPSARTLPAAPTHHVTPIDLPLPLPQRDGRQGTDSVWRGRLLDILV